MAKVTSHNAFPVFFSSKIFFIIYLSSEESPIKVDMGHFELNDLDLAASYRAILQKFQGLDYKIINHLLVHNRTKS